MTIFSISHNFGRTSAILLVVLLSRLVLASEASEKDPPWAMDALLCRIVTWISLPPESRPQWARFSPFNSRLAIVDLGGHDLLASIPHGTTRRIGEGFTPVGWLVNSLVVRDRKGNFRLLDVDKLTPARSLSLGSLPLAWTLGKDRRLQFDLVLPETATTGIPLLIPGAHKNGQSIVAHEDRLAITIGSGGADSSIVDAGGRTVFRGGKKIYRISPSPDEHKILIYYGNTEYVIYNRLTRRTTRLPAIIHSWTWFPDSTTLLGDVSSSVQPGREEVTSTSLYAYDLIGGGMSRIALPPSIRDVAIKVLDLSRDGLILIDTEKVFPKPAYLGLVVLELLWK